jgi:hypothetical protein
MRRVKRRLNRAAALAEIFVFVSWGVCTKEN